jgi:hypothetical protein
VLFDLINALVPALNHSGNDSRFPKLDGTVLSKYEFIISYKLSQAIFTSLHSVTILQSVSKKKIIQFNKISAFEIIHHGFRKLKILNLFNTEI